MKIKFISKDEKSMLVMIGTANHRFFTKDGGKTYDFELHGLTKETIRIIREQEIESIKLNNLKNSIMKKLSKEELDVLGVKN